MSNDTSGCKDLSSTMIFFESLNLPRFDVIDRFLPSSSLREGS